MTVPAETVSIPSALNVTSILSPLLKAWLLILIPPSPIISHVASTSLPLHLRLYAGLTRAVSALLISVTGTVLCTSMTAVESAHMHDLRAIIGLRSESSRSKVYRQPVRQTVANMISRIFSVFVYRFISVRI